MKTKRSLELRPRARTTRIRTVRLPKSYWSKQKFRQLDTYVVQLPKRRRRRKKLLRRVKGASRAKANPLCQEVAYRYTSKAAMDLAS